MFAKSDEILSMILQDIKETKRYGRTVGLSFENSIPSHKHNLGGIIKHAMPFFYKSAVERIYFMNLDAQFQCTLA